MPEWNMEKYRFYVDLPGDFWESGVMMRYLRSKEIKVCCVRVRCVCLSPASIILIHCVFV
jgi:hypothetical protein